MAGSHGGRDEVLRVIYEVIYSFTRLYDRYFLPFIIHDYIYRLIRDGVMPDYWRDWVLTATGWYSISLSHDILVLKEKGYLVETCTPSGRLCGVYTLAENTPEPKRIYLALI
jgi:hypothetical protein